MKKEHQYFVYIVSNPNRTTFYTGFTNLMVRRLIEHRYGLGSEFTRKYKLRHLLYWECYQYVSDAIAREKEIKGWRRAKKIALIKEMNPKMKDLGQELFDELGLSREDVKEIAESLKKQYKQ